jgi:two-component system phosphate regulon sensor histidine kinase PhoR
VDISSIIIDLLIGAAAGATLAALILTRYYATRRNDSTVIGYLQNNLNQSKEMVQTMFNRLLQMSNSTFDGIIVVDSDRRVTLVNDSAEKIFEVNAPVIGTTLIGVTANHQLDNMVEQVISSHEPIEDQLELRSRSFKVRITWVDSRTIILALQDVTELLRLTRARRDMVANISHELRTPISSIRLMLDTLTQNYGKNRERDLSKLAKIDKETESLQYLVQELHDLSMIESGKAIMRMVETPFATILRDALNRMSSQIEQKRLSISNQIPDDLLVLADPDQTRRVLTNVISNSAKFTPANGTISFTATPDETMVTIRVADTGIGIPPTERIRIFERFYQVDSSRTGSGGSGLGLAIAKHIIEAQGGKIWAEPSLPQGTTICFTIPLTTD